ncbi:MAG: glycosyltransferase family 39 protein [Candidatus Altiarchaeota archaeon]|nr:glycosyltransferase family 39 protein [Candidatus Altiarchaeota archaeon]
MMDKKKILLALIIFSGFFLRSYSLFLPTLSDSGIYAYLAYEVYNGKKPYVDFFMPAPPLDIYLISLSYRIFGVSIASSMLPTVFFSCLSIPLVYVAAKKFYGDDAALLATFAFSLEPNIIAYTSNNFLTSEPLFFSLLASYLYLSGLGGKSRCLFFAGLSAGLATMGKYLGLMVFVSMVIHTLLIRKSLKSILVVSSGFLSVILLFMFLFLSQEMIDQTAVYYLLREGFPIEAKLTVVLPSIFGFYALTAMLFFMGLGNLIGLNIWKDHDKYFTINILVAILSILAINNNHFFMYGVYFSISVYAMVLLGCRTLDYVNKPMFLLLLFLFLGFTAVSDIRIMTCNSLVSTTLAEDIEGAKEYILANTDENSKLLVIDYPLHYIPLLTKRQIVAKGIDLDTYRLDFDLDDEGINSMKEEASFILHLDFENNPEVNRLLKREDELNDRFGVSTDAAKIRNKILLEETTKVYESGPVRIHSVDPQ